MNDQVYAGSLKVSPEAFPPPPDLPGGEGDAETTAVLAGGCFWCVEAVYCQLEGVREVTSGYAGGEAATANYTDVCTGRTGHAEAVRIVYDSGRIGYGELLRVYFSIAHDPTQHNRQGADRGPQYRSAIFYANEGQRELAARYIAELDAAGVFTAPIATTLEPLGAFYPAEPEHQDYAARNPGQPYIAHTAAPKVEKLRRHRGDLLKTPGKNP